MQATNESRPTGWVGWIVFAGVFMIVAGVLGAIEGLAGILRDESYFLVPSEGLLVFDLTTWGWIHLILGIALAIVGYLLIQGSTVGAVVSIIVVTLHLVAQFVWIAASPWWSLALIAIDVLILYAIIVHGGELQGD